MTPPRRPLSLALVGATGTVGRAVLDALDDLDVPVRALRAFAGPRSANTTLAFRGDDVRVEALREGAFRSSEVAIFCAGAEVARQWAPRAWVEGCVAVDDSPAFRGEPDVPLVVPEVNAAALAGFRARGIVASPLASAIGLAVALAPLRAAAGLRRVVVATYQSVSGLGQGGIEELEREARDLLNLREPDPAARFPHRIAFNVIPQVGALGEDGVSEDEARLARELRRVLGDEGLRIAATAVRVPVFFGHSLAVNVETERKLAPAEARELLRKAPGVKVVDDPAARVYPMPMLVANEDAVLVGRIRADDSVENGLALFLALENTRKGAATNAVQIAAALAEAHLPAR